MRPLCQACQRNPAAVNCHRGSKTYYRSRCDRCIRAQRRVRPPQPRWFLAGYRKKPSCDRCGFRARLQSQLTVWHINGNLNDCEIGNLRTVCMNCVQEVQHHDLPWRRGDLEADH